MRNGLVRSLALFVVFGAAYYFILNGRVSGPALLLGTLALAIGMSIAANLAWKAANAIATRRLLERSLAGAPFLDGELVAAAGPIHPIDEPLPAPLTSRACVACEYRMEGSGSYQGPFATSTAGLALAASVIESQSGNARLLAWPGLGNFAASQCDEDQHRERAREYVAATKFDLGPLTGAFSPLDAPVANAEGRLKIDVATGDDTNPDGKRLTERVVPVGAQVCAVGTWDAARGGIVASPGSTSGVELFPGKAESMLKGLTSRAAGAATGAIVVAAFVHAVAWIALKP